MQLSRLRGEEEMLGYEHFYTYSERWKPLFEEFPELNLEQGVCWFACLSMLLNSVSTKPTQDLYDAAKLLAAKVFPEGLENLLNLHKTMMLIRPTANEQTQIVVDYLCQFHTGIKAVLYMMPLMKIDCWCFRKDQNQSDLLDFMLDQCSGRYNLLLTFQVNSDDDTCASGGHVIYFDSSNAQGQQITLSDPNYSDPLLFDRQRFTKWLNEENPYTRGRRIKFGGYVYGFKIDK
ncbi:MAG: hypothetical protein NTW79_02505 [Candidatus Berkelbacteria bacterium]|nr:hypothetical protein [Candidatus Berkelbacteria bacterium]